MKKFIEKMMKKAQKFTILDYSIFKICLVAFGLLLATAVPAIGNVNPWIYGVIFAVTWVYLIFRVFKK